MAFTTARGISPGPRLNPAAERLASSRLASTRSHALSGGAAIVQYVQPKPRRAMRGVVRLSASADPETEGSPLDFPEEWVKANPSRRPDIFPEFKPMKPQLPQPMPGDPEQPDDEEEELLKRKKPGKPDEPDKKPDEEDPEKEKEKPEEKPEEE